MPLITKAIPNLIGGVSQQSPAVRSGNQCEVMENAFPSPVEGLIKRPPTSKVAELRDTDDTILTVPDETLVKPHMIIRDLSEKYLCLIQSSGISVYNLNGTQQTVTYGSGALAYLSGATRDTIKALTIADVTFILNTNTVALADAAVTNAQDNTKKALVFVKQDNYAKSFTITLQNSGAGVTAYTYTSPDTAAVNAEIGTNTVAQGLATLINGNQNYTATAVDGVIYITRATSFTCVVEDDFGGQGMVLIRGEAQRFEDLPSTAPTNYHVKVAGAPESKIDDYWVTFTGDSGGFSKGIWREGIATSVEYQMNYGTMPHVLIRQSNGTFLFKKADGNDGFPDYKWLGRLVGDTSSNSNPSFIGQKISNMILFKNRLGFMAGENIVLSEASEFFSFFRSTVLDIPDSDPIDVSSSSQKIGSMKSGVVFNTELMLFTESSQLVLRGGEILSPKSVVLLPVGDYESYADIQPVSSGLSVYFAYNRGGGFAGVREMVPQPNIDGSYIVNTVSDTVPNYIVGKPTSVTATTQEDMMAVVADGSMYLYKYLRTQEQSLQSAWFRFQFPDVATGGLSRVIWAEFVDAYLYILTLRNTAKNPVLERIRFGVDQTDADVVSGANWTTHLDARNFFASGAGVYNSTTGLTTWTLAKPYSYSSTLTYVCTTNGVRVNITTGTSYNQTTDVAGTVVATGDYSAVPVWCGYKYEMVYQFSPFYLPARTINGSAAIQTGRYQLKNLNLLFEDTAFFKIQTTVGLDQSQYEYVYSGSALGSSVLNQISLERGSYRAPIFGKNTETAVTITNDSPLPCKLISAEVEGDYNDRAQRFA